jgi:hypothetical protein
VASPTERRRTAARNDAAAFGRSVQTRRASRKLGSSRQCCWCALKSCRKAQALADLHLSLHNTVAVGDAENDLAMFGSCECAAAVSNALETVKERADVVLARDHGAGVVELIGQLEADDLASVEPNLTRNHVLLGTRDDGREVSIPPYGRSVLVAGTSGSGKSTLTTGLLERLAEAKYQIVSCSAVNVTKQALRKSWTRKSG